MVLIEDKLVDFNANFCLFLITHNDSPKILPCLGSVISYVNFTTTETGLSGQVSCISFLPVEYFFVFCKSRIFNFSAVFASLEGVDKIYIFA